MARSQMSEDRAWTAPPGYPVMEPWEWLSNPSGWNKKVDDYWKSRAEADKKEIKKNSKSRLGRREREMIEQNFDSDPAKKPRAIKRR